MPQSLPESPSANKLKRTVFFSLAVITGIALVEGLSSLTLFTIHSIRHPETMVEHAHSEFDPDLGWINRASTYRPDMYGPGVYLRTNAQRFRNNADLQRAVPEGKCRVVCSGDSFTLGYGVDNDHTWVHLLQSEDPGLQTVNMGQGGYGVDQAYLWYERDGTTLEHDIHCFAFITADFQRMLSGQFLGYAKPKLGIQGGRLVIENAPLTPSSWGPYWVRYAPVVQDLGMARAMEAVARRLRPPLNDVAEIESLGPVVLKIFENLKELNRRKKSVLTVTHLPVAQDHYTDRSDGWRAFLAEELPKRGINYIDLIPEFRTWPFDRAVKMFIGADSSGDLRKAEHYSAEGNRVMANLIYRRLIALPEVSTRLSALRQPQGTP